jgi:alkyl hydroperoxide reductase subunit F
MLDDAIKAQLKAYLEKVIYPIEIVANLDDSDNAKQVLALVQDIASLSDKVSYRETADSSVRAPSFSINRIGSDIKVRFAGLPMGHEFTSLILALLQVGGHPSKEEADLLEQIRKLDGKYDFVTYISLTCHNCPDIVQALNLMAVLNENISHVMVDGSMYQAEVTERNIMAVPTIYLNGEHFGQGRMSLAEIVAKLDTGAAAREAEKLNAKEAYDVLIVGGGPAGAAAAIYAARKGIRTGIVTERFGGQVLDTLGIENFISVKATEGPKLVAALEQHVREYDVDIMPLQRAESIVPATKPGGLLEVRLAGGATFDRRTLERNKCSRRTGVPQ